MKKIKPLYLKEAINIRLKYHELIEKNDIITQQLQTEYQNIILLKNQLNSINDTGNLNDKQQLYEVMLRYEQTINSLEQFSKPILKDMEDLQNRSIILYGKIMKEYPNNTEKEVKEQLFKQLQENGIN